MTDIELKHVLSPRPNGKIMDKIKMDIMSIFCRFNTLGGENYEQFNKAAFPVIVDLCEDMLKEGMLRACLRMDEAENRLEAKEEADHD